MQTIRIKNVEAGAGKPLLIISGPCVIESLEQCVQIGTAVRDRCHELGFGYIFKASFDKANRSSIHSARGPGLEKGVDIIHKVGQKLGVPTTTDIHESQQAARAAQGIDLLQIPAFLCRQTDLLLAAAETGRPVNVKKGQFLSPAEMKGVVTKLTEAKASGIMLTERGTFFGYNRLVNDFIGVADMMELGFPVCFDVTHSTQQPGGQGTHSGGRPERAPMLAKAAAAIGVQALFLETHPDPKNAFSDAATVLPIETTLKLLGDVKKIRDAVN
jgi:2-dehydro-3-deoxyphosphooctonate aldolase (KDO 8-P synthase)